LSVKVLLWLVLLLVVSVLIILFGDLPSFRGTLIEKIRTLIVHEFYEKFVLVQFQKVDRNYFNGYLSRVLLGREVMWVLGWLVPLFYLVIFSKCIEYFFKTSFSSLNKYSRVNWFQLWIIIVPSIALNYVSFLMATFADPGSLRKLSANPEQLERLRRSNIFKSDGVIFFDDVDCKTCNLPKMARSKHCSSCENCALMFDHHCVWLNNDVGYYNYRYFIMFLVSTIWIFVYGGYLNYQALNLYLTNEKLPDYIASVSYIKQIWLLITKSTVENEVAGILLCLCVLLCPLLIMFLYEHVHNMYMGVTTNETAKWEYINHLVVGGYLYKLYTPDNRVNYIVLDDETDPNHTRFVRLEDEVTVVNITPACKLIKVRDWQDLYNVYDKGFINNVKERLF
ncbi:hypothetical protein CANARDRAFT_189297, partial [[Candida] arabinofermentans NRRL YB-2248]